MITLNASCVATALGAALLYWVVWPDLTAQKFISLMAGGEFDTAINMLTPNSEVSMHPWQLTVQRVLRDSGAQFESRSTSDVIHCRRRFRIGRTYEYTASKGRVHRAYRPLLHEDDKAFRTDQ